MPMMQAGMNPAEAVPPTMAAMLEPVGAVPTQVASAGQEVNAAAQAADPGYNGTVMVNGVPVQVTNGDAVDEGEVVFITADGSMVIDENRQIIGYVEGGVMKPMDAAHLAGLQQRGLVGG